MGDENGPTVFCSFRCPSAFCDHIHLVVQVSLRLPVPAGIPAFAASLTTVPRPMRATLAVLRFMKVSSLCLQTRVEERRREAGLPRIVFEVDAIDFEHLF